MVPEISSRTDRIFCHFGQFFPHLPPINPKNQNLKSKKTPGDIIILHKCTKNHDPMLHCSWDMVCDGCKLFFILGHFLPFYPLTAQKMKISKKWKKQLEMSSFYTSIPKIMIIWYTVPVIWYVTDVIVIFHFGLFFALLPT